MFYIIIQEGGWDEAWDSRKQNTMWIDTIWEGHLTSHIAFHWKNSPDILVYSMWFCPTDQNELVQRKGPD